MTPTSGPTVARWKWGVVWLLFLATMLNYMDRQTLGSTAKYIKEDFGLSKEGYGWVEFWFGITFGLVMFPAGFLADRLNLRWLYASTLLLWSAAGFLTGLADTFVMLVACRVVLGFGEAFNWPCAVGAVRRIIPPESRSLANGIFHGGASIGAMLTPLLVLFIVRPTGENWRLVFQVVGALGLVWLVLWLTIVSGERAAAISQPPADGEGETSTDLRPVRFLDLFRLRNFWIVLAVSISVNLTWHFFRIWLPLFFDEDLKFSQRDIQYLLAGYFVISDLGSMTAGWMTRRLSRAGRSVASARKVVMMGTSAVCLLATPAALVMDPWVTVPLVFLVGAGALGGFATYFSLSQDVSARHTSVIVGFASTVAWIVIAVLQPYIGALVDRIGTFAPCIIAAGFIPLFGAVANLFWIERPEPHPEDQTW